MTSFPEGDSLDALLPRLGENRAGRQLVAGLRGDDGHLARADIDPAAGPHERKHAKREQGDCCDDCRCELSEVVHFAPPFSFAKALLAGIPIISRGSSAVTTSVTRGAVFSYSRALR